MFLWKSCNSGRNSFLHIDIELPVYDNVVADKRGQFFMQAYPLDKILVAFHTAEADSGSA